MLIIMQEYCGFVWYYGFGGQWSEKGILLRWMTSTGDPVQWNLWDEVPRVGW